MKLILIFFAVICLSAPLVAQDIVFKGSSNTERSQFLGQDAEFCFEADLLTSYVCLESGANLKISSVEKLSDGSVLYHTESARILIESERMVVSPPTYTKTPEEQIEGCERSILKLRPCNSCPSYWVYSSSALDIVFFVAYDTARGYYRSIVSEEYVNAGYK